MDRVGTEGQTRNNNTNFKHELYEWIGSVPKVRPGININFKHESFYFMNGRDPLKMKYRPSIAAVLGLVFLIAINILLFLGRKKVSLRAAFLENSFTDFYQHISNFSIGLIIYCIVGFIWLLKGVPFRHIAAMAIALIFINAVYELWMPVLNTKDITDAYYGIAGALTGFVFLSLVNKYGLKGL